MKASRNHYGQLVVKDADIWARLYWRERWTVEFQLNNQWEYYTFDTHSEAYRFMLRVFS